MDAGGGTPGVALAALQCRQVYDKCARPATSRSPTRSATGSSAGEFAPGRLLPSEAELSQTYGASRVTVRRALEVLRDEGLVDSRQGFGWFVSADPVRQSLGRLGTIESQLLAEGVRSERAHPRLPLPGRARPGARAAGHRHGAARPAAQPGRRRARSPWSRCGARERYGARAVTRRRRAVRPSTSCSTCELGGAVQTIGARGRLGPRRRAAGGARRAHRCCAASGSPRPSTARSVLVSEHTFPAHLTEFVVDLPHAEASIAPERAAPGRVGTLAAASASLAACAVAPARSRGAPSVDDACADGRPADEAGAAVASRRRGCRGRRQRDASIEPDEHATSGLGRPSLVSRGRGGRRSPWWWAAARAPAPPSLQQKLRQVNGLSAFQAKCVATGLEHALTDKEMRQVAAADGRGGIPDAQLSQKVADRGVALRVRTQHHPAAAGLLGGRRARARPRWSRRSPDRVQGQILAAPCLRSRWCGSSLAERPGAAPGAGSGPLSDGVSPAWARWRAVHQSAWPRRPARPPHASMRAAKRRESSPSAGTDGRAEGDGAWTTAWRHRAALAQDAARCPRGGRARPARRSAATGRRRRRGTAGPSRRGCGRPRGRSTCSSRRR